MNAGGEGWRSVASENRTDLEAIRDYSGELPEEAEAVRSALGSMLADLDAAGGGD